MAISFVKIACKHAKIVYSQWFEVSEVGVLEQVLSIYTSQQVVVGQGNAL